MQNMIVKIMIKINKIKKLKQKTKNKKQMTMKMKDKTNKINKEEPMLKLYLLENKTNTQIIYIS